MCLGVPGRVVDIDGNTATVDFWGVRRQVLLDVVDEPVAVGDYVLNHVGFAIRRIPESEIGETLALFEQLLAQQDDGRPDGRRRARRKSRDRERRPMSSPDPGAAFRELKFRDPSRARAMVAGAAPPDGARSAGRRVSLMHVCGSHEQAIAKFGLRATLPPALNVIMGPGCPVCITDTPEVDEGVALALQGVHIAHLRRHAARAGHRHLARGRPGRGREGRRRLQRGAGRRPRAPLKERWCSSPPASKRRRSPRPRCPARACRTNLSILSAHKFIPPAMEIVAEMPGLAVEGFLAAGHAATITGWGSSSRFVERHRLPVVVAGFEPLDILAALVKLLELVRDGTPRSRTCIPRCVTREGNLQRAGAALGGVPAGRRPVARHRGHPGRQPEAARRVRPRRCAEAFRHRPRAALGHAPPALARVLHLRQHHGRASQSPGDCPLFGGGVHAGAPGGRLHGEQRGHLQDLASVRRLPRPRRRRVSGAAASTTGSGSSTARAAGRCAR